MELGELLTELRENMLHDRSDRISGSSDYLWSDATLVRYIDEGQRTLARKALILRDGTTPEVTRITLQTGVTEYDLHESVISVISAKVSGDSSDLCRTGHAALSGQQVSYDNYFNINTSTTAGKPIAYTTDEEIVDVAVGSRSGVKLRVSPAPSVDYNGTVIELRVVRLPIERLSTNDLCAVPEVPEDFHLPMLDWAAYLALRIVDLDAGAPDRAREFQANFMAMVEDARRTTMRKLAAPHRWGFGAGGYVWEH